MQDREIIDLKKCADVIDFLAYRFSRSIERVDLVGPIGRKLIGDDAFISESLLTLE